MDCRAVRDALGFDQPKANGSYYSSMEVTYNYAAKAGEEVVYLIPDGYTNVRKTYRTGLYTDAFARVKAHKDATDAKRAYDDWHRNMNQGLAARAKYGAVTSLMDWDAYIEAFGPEPPAPRQEVIDRVNAAKAAEAEVERQVEIEDRRISNEDDEDIIEILLAHEWDESELNDNGLPRRNVLRNLLGRKLDNENKKRLWALAEEQRVPMAKKKPG